MENKIKEVFSNVNWIEATILAIVGIVFLAIFLGILISLNGFVLMTLWGWFIVPTFGLAPLSIPVAYGICLITAFTARGLSTNKEVKWYTFFVYPMSILLVGYIVKLFM